MSFMRQIRLLMFLATAACSDTADTRFKRMNDRQDLERQKGQTCAAKSNIKKYRNDLFSSQQQLLAFEFPDGVMGGHGKIIGNRKLDSLSDSQCGLLQFEKCAGMQLYENSNWDHMIFIVTPSTPQNNKVVACALENLADHFNIGFSSTVPKDFGRLNEEPFKHLHSRSAKTDAQTR